MIGCSCCVDEVAAAHASCDAIAHYGDACLSALAEDIPVRFFFGSLPVDLAIFREHVRNYLTTNASTSLLLLTDVLYSEKIDELENCVRQEIPKEKQLFRADVVDPTQHSVPAMHSSEVSSLGRVVPQGFCETAATQVCFVGDPTSALIPLWLMTYPQCSSIVCFDPQTATTAELECQSWLQLRRRLFLIEKLRDAATVGLVVGSVAVQGHAKAVKRMRNMCKASGKKLYVISVGKVNVPKLSNFAEVDVFVLLSCPFGIIFDSSSFLRPVLSMFEAEIALNPSKTWFADGGWCADLTQFVNEHEIHLMEMERQAGFDALVQTVNIMAGRVDAIFNRVAQMQDDIRILIERTTPTSNCVFCAIGENVDGHHSARCHRYTDPFSRAMRISQLHLCGRCLRPEHDHNCTVTCNVCRGEHNSVLCPSRGGTPVKRRKL